MCVLDKRVDNDDEFPAGFRSEHGAVVANSGNDTRRIAAAGDFERAVATAERGLDEASPEDPVLRYRIEVHLAQYKQGASLRTRY